MNTIGSMERLIYYFSKLPGVGRKTAERYAYKVLDMTLDDVKDFASSLIDTKENVKFCTKCGNFTENDICDISIRFLDTLQCFTHKHECKRLSVCIKNI